MAHKDPLARFASRWELRDGSDCWWWTAGVGSHGYGSFHAEGRATTGDASTQPTCRSAPGSRTWKMPSLAAALPAASEAAWQC